MTSGGPGPVAPMAYSHRMSTFSQLHNVQFIGDHTNTVAHLTGAWNGKWDNVEIWGAGTFKGWKKVPDGVRFNGASSSSTITATGNIFTAEDVGKAMLIVDTTARAGRHIITNYVSQTEVTIDRPLSEVYDNAYGWFEGVRGSMSAGSSVLTLETGVLTADDVGRWVVVGGQASNKPQATKTGLLAQIETVSSSTGCTLSKAADNEVVMETVYVSPGIIIANDDQGDTTNDHTLDDIRIESFAGLGCFLEGTQIKSNGLKAHGRAMVQEGTIVSPYADEVAQCSGIFAPLIMRFDNLTVESQVLDEYRLLVQGMRSGMSIGNIMAARAENQKLLKATNCNSQSSICVGSINYTNDVNDSKFAQEIEHDYSLRHVQMAEIPTYLGVESPRQFGMGSFAAPAFNSNAGRGSFINDDTVFELYIPPTYLNRAPSNLQRGGFLKIFSTANLNAFAEISYVQNVHDAVAGISIWQQAGTLYESSTSPLTGTTGTDGKITVSLSGANDYIQIENRSGGGLMIGWYFVAN
jgi:hypothetical protein